MSEQNNTYLELFVKMEGIAKVAFVEAIKTYANFEATDGQLDHMWQNSTTCAGIEKWKDYARAGRVLEMANEVLKDA